MDAIVALKGDNGTVIDAASRRTVDANKSSMLIERDMLEGLKA
jgi:hypothetical protein